MLTSVAPADWALRAWPVLALLACARAGRARLVSGGSGPRRRPRTALPCTPRASCGPLPPSPAQASQGASAAASRLARSAAMSSSVTLLTRLGAVAVVAVLAVAALDEARQTLRLG